MTTSEFKQQIDEKTDVLIDKLESDRDSLGLDKSSGVDSRIVQEAGDDVETASGGVLSANDYTATRDAPVISPSDVSEFNRIFEDVRNRLMFEASNNINAFTRQGLKQALKIIEEIDNLLAQIAVEAASVSLASALLTPPARADVIELQSAAQEVHDKSVYTAEDLRSARARRTAAKRHLANDPIVSRQSAEIVKTSVENRYLEPIADPRETGPATISGSYATAKHGAANLEVQAQATGRVDQRLTEATP